MLKNILVVDLDDTICFPNLEYTDTRRRYELASPNLPMIQSLHKAKAKGFEIIIFTARRMATHQGNLEKIEKDVGDVTRNWLDKNNVPYDKLKFGKPFAVYYIDDKAIRPNEFVEIMNNE